MYEIFTSALAIIAHIVWIILHKWQNSFMSVVTKDLGKCQVALWKSHTSLHDAKASQLQIIFTVNNYLFLKQKSMLKMRKIQNAPIRFY